MRKPQKESTPSTMSNSASLNNMSREMATWENASLALRSAMCHLVAKLEQAKMVSDPFVYKVTYSLLSNNTMTPYDYNVDVPREAAAN